MKIYNSTQNNLIADNVKIAKTFYKRGLGLLFKRNILENEGLIIKPCCSIHTFFMKFSIDVLFVNKKNKVVVLYENVKPFRILPINWTSHYVIELKAGQVLSKSIQKYDIIQINEDE